MESVVESYQNDNDEPLFADDLDDDPPPLPPPLDLPTDTPSFFSQIRREAGDLRVGLEDVTATQTNSELQYREECGLKTSFKRYFY